MNITTIAGALLLLAASGAALAQGRPTADTAAPVPLPAAPACTGPACAAPATANHAINEKGTPGTACPKPTTPPPPSTGGGCHNPCICPPPN